MRPAVRRPATWLVRSDTIHRVVTTTSSSAGGAFRTTLGLFETGVELMRQNLRRSHPNATQQEIESRLDNWLRDVTRPQDLSDLRALQDVASPNELQRAKDSVALITARGYHRGRDLAAEMNKLFLQR